MDHIIERILSLQSQITALPKDCFIKPISVVSHVEEHAQFDQLDSGLSRYARTVYAPAYVDSYTHYHITSVRFVPFAVWRNRDSMIRYGNAAGYKRPWRAYLWSTYVEKHDFTTSYESLQESPDEVKRSGLVAEGITEGYYEYYTFPPEYEVKMKPINDRTKAFCDPVRDFIAELQASKCGLR